MFPTKSNSKKVQHFEEIIKDDVGDRVLLGDEGKPWDLKVGIVCGGFVAEVTGSTTPMYFVRLLNGTEIVIMTQQWLTDFYGKDHPDCQIQDCPKWLRFFQKRFNDWVWGDPDSSAAPAWRDFLLGWLGRLMISKLGYS